MSQAKLPAGAFHHIDLNVSDIAAAKAVYGPLLEFFGYRLVKDRPDGCEWDLVPGASLGIRLRAPEEAEHPHRRYAPGIHHLAWRASSRSQVDEVHARLASLGVTVLDPPASYPEYSGDYYAAFFEDPDGIKLEVVHSPGWI